MNPRIVSDTIVTTQRKWLLFSVRKPQSVWRIVSAFTGEPELMWFSTEAEAEAALDSSKKSEAHILGIVKGMIEGGSYENVQGRDRAELIAIMRSGDIQQVRQKLEELIGSEKAGNLMKSLHREKIMHDTYIAVVKGGVHD